MASAPPRVSERNFRLVRFIVQRALEKHDAILDARVI
jgi:hypothetical protein